VRAQTAKESYWFQRNGGDLTTDRSRCYPGAPVDGQGQCAESLGLMQVRYPYWGASFPSAVTSSAYNLDVALAARRSCLEGRETWLGGSYGPGDIWGCVGLWFSGRWHDAGAETYIAAVQDWLAQRIWTTPSFISAT
jgi:autotransporter family porin